MNQRSIGYIGAFALVMAPLLAAAQQPTPPERQTPPEQSGVRIENRTVEGEVVELNAQRIVVRTTDGNRMTFTVDRDLTTGATPIAVGQRVRVEYKSGSDPLAVITVSRIPGEPGKTVSDTIEDAGEKVADEAEGVADRLEDVVDDDNGDDQEPARVAPAPSAAARMQDPERPQDPARPSSAATRSQDPDDDELPATATPLPALILAGLALLGSGFGLSARRRQ
jgi:LPXTG-motif cell wall-anchored protein